MNVRKEERKGRKNIHHIFYFVEPDVRWSWMGKNYYLFCFLRPVVLKSMVPNQQCKVSIPWELLEMQILRPYPGPTEPETLG